MKKDRELIKNCQKIWAENKYLVLSKSQKKYMEIRAYLKGDSLDLDWLKNKIEETKSLEEDRGQFINATQHVWGYFKKYASVQEREDFLFLCQAYLDNKIDQLVILDFLGSMLKVYPNEYLEKSNFLGGKLE